MNNETMYKIYQAKNGYILERQDNVDGEAGDVETLVGIDGEDEHETFAAFLQDILNNYGPPEGRYSPKRIYVRIEPGDNTEGKPENIDWYNRCLLDSKDDSQTFEEWGRKIYEEARLELEKSEEFKEKNGYR